MNKILAILALSLAAVSAFAQCADCDKGAKQAKTEECCDAKSGMKPFNAKDAAYLKEAEAMFQASAGDECCKSTAEHHMQKGDPGCCNNGAEPAKFKVFVAGHGYKFFGCEDSAGKERQILVAKGVKVGKIQKVRTKRTIASS